MKAYDMTEAEYVEAEYAAAEKRMMDTIARKQILPNLVRVAAPKKTLDDVFTRQERLLMAYAPVVMAESIWQYIDKVLAFCASERIDAVKKLTRKVKEVRKAYYDFLEKSIDQAHRDSAAASAEQFRSDFGRDIAIMWFTVRNELPRLHPDATYVDMRTDALSAILLTKVMTKYCRDTDAEIRRRLNIQRADTLNPILRDLDVIMDGYVGDYEIDRTELVRRCEVILYNAMQSIEYNE